MRIAFKTAWLGALLGACIAATPVLAQTAAVLPPDWVQVGTRGVDAAVDEDGRRWMVGTDGRAYRWNEADARWLPHGTRSDLARIDAGRDGAVALTRGGELLITGNAAPGEWRPTGMRASDVGIGGGRIWLADALAPDGGRAAMHAAFDAGGRALEWTRVPGRIARIDVDGAGRPWALDAQGRLFVLADGQWIADAAAPAAADIGVGAGGAIVLVGRDGDAAQGGGPLFLRDPQSGAWTRLPGRLVAVSVDAEGRAFGVNSLSWVLGSTRGATTLAARDPQAPAERPLGPGEVRLAALAPPGITLAAGLAGAKVKLLSGNPAASAATVVGETTLNGLATRVARYAPAAGGPPNLVLAHKVLRIGDYVPELRDTAARDFALSDVLVSFVPAANAEKKPRGSDAAVLAGALDLPDFAGFAPPAGTALAGTLDLAGVPGGAAAATLLGLGTGKLPLTARNVDAALFREVREGRAPAATAPARTLKDLADKYGAKLVESLAFEAPMRALDGKPFGPAKLSGPGWSFALAQGEQSVTLSIGMAATLSLAVLAPAPDSAGQAAAARSGSAVRATPETLQLSDVRVLFEPLKRSANLSGRVTRAAADRVAALKGFALDTAAFTGQLTLADGESSFTNLKSLKALDLTLASSGRLPSQATTAGAKVDLEVKLALNDERNAVVPSVTATGGLTLADIAGSYVPGADRIALTRVEWSPGYVAGTVTLSGEPIRAVRYQAAGMPAAIVGLHHQELDLGTYIPKIRDTSLGTLGLANAVLFVLPETASRIRYEKRDDMPKPLSDLLERKAIPDEDIFPLTIHPGVNLIGQYGSNPGADGGNARKAMEVYGVADKTYVVKASFKPSQIRRFGAGRPPGTSAKAAWCGVVSAADKADASGLDLSFKLPDFRPPYAGSAVAFSNSSFALKEIDGQLEPSIVTAMDLTLPQAAIGIRTIGMAAKVRVKGDLNVLCKGVTPDSNFEVGFAGSTALNLADVGKTAFAALERVTKLDAPEEKEAPATSSTPTDPAQARALALADAAAKKLAEAMAKAKERIKGWKPAFGMPFLEIRQFAAAGTFAQKDGKRNLTGTLWTSSVVGSQTMDVLGSVTLESDAAANEFKLADWLLRVPGPVRLTGLPGVDKLAAAIPTFEAGDFTVSKLELSPRLMSGTLSSAQRALTGSMVATTDAQDGGWQLFAGVNRLAPDMLLKANARLPGTMGNLTLGRSLFALRSAPTATTRLSDLPPRATKLFTDTVGDLVTPDSAIPLVRGVSVAGRLNPAEIPADPKFANLKAFFDTLEMNQAMPVFGGIEPGQGGFMEAWLPKMRVPGLPQAGLSEARHRSRRRSRAAARRTGRPRCAGHGLRGWRRKGAHCRCAA